MKDKKFDCMEMTRRGAQLVYEEVKGMTTEQELEYWKAATDRLIARQKASRSKRRRSA